jgi:ParB/RepB/Spo0J family partition protein
MNESPILIDLTLLKPHPDNPRVVEREDVITAIEQQIRDGGFDSSHAILVRPHDGAYQIINGHNRTAAARRAGFTQIPAWVREMDDETAFMQLVLANAQSELSPLERGIHALAATEKGKHNGKSISAYAAAVGSDERTVRRWVAAAEVAKKSGTGAGFPGEYTVHLAEIHSAPQHCWPALVERLISKGWSVGETKGAVRAVTSVRPPRGYESLFAIDRLQDIAARGENTEEVVKPLVRSIERGKGDIRDGGFCLDEYLARFTGWLVKHGPWDAKATTNEAFAILDEQRKAHEEAETKAAKLKQPVTLAQWKTLSEPERQTYLAVRNDKAKLLHQETDSAIDWARFSWNPVTGCQHNCPYCYARDIAERFYPQKFEPSIVPDALAAPLNARPPKESDTDVGYKNIFTCSMADLFGRWVPREWIEAAICVMRLAPAWNFLLLTKFPQRYAEFEFPENVWLGTTVDCQARAANAERAMASAKASVKWISVEPLIEPIAMDWSIFSWVVIGGASKSTQTPEWKPPREWVMDLTCRAKAAGCGVYWKTNLNLDPMRDFPGSVVVETDTAPDQFHYLKPEAQMEKGAV